MLFYVHIISFLKDYFYFLMEIMVRCVKMDRRKSSFAFLI